VSAEEGPFVANDNSDSRYASMAGDGIHYHTASGLLQTRDIATISEGSGVQALVVLRLNVAPEKFMSPIAHSPMTLSPPAAV
jgi:hypothetical protein